MAEILPIKLVDLGSGQGELAEFDPGDTLPQSLVPAPAPWACLPIGMPIPIWDHIAGVAVPPTDDPAFRYIKLTASDAYNAGALTGEAVSGSAPLVIAAAVVSLIGSPLYGKNIQLINTERRVIRAGQSGVVEQDALESHGHRIEGRGINAGASAAYTTARPGNLGAGDQTGNGGAADQWRDDYVTLPVGARAANETRPKNIGATYYMRIL